DVSFGVPEKSLIAVIGPSGSGKSTLLKALTGYRPANEGDVLYDNRNLYKQFAELRQRIGLVPQDDILHKELTVRKALKYAAKLRFPGDTAESEREARIDEVLRELKLDIHKEKRVTSLSGGQRKRVSVALELLTKPSLIFLDEPTSGLDPGMDRDVMQLLRGLADDGRTVLVVTHSVAELAICDKLLVMAPGGSVAYFGPPEEALNFFGYTTWADVFSAFENYRDYDWAGRWRGSQHYQMYAADIDAVAAQSVHMPSPQQMRPPKP
ncbi:ATP-binding cassette domain-containing protein, partial [Streptomyces niveus]